MASIQRVQQLRVTGSHESDVAQGAAKDAAALRDMADAADQAAAAGEKLGQKARVTNEELRRTDPTLAAINKKIDENTRLTAETARAHAVYAKSVNEVRGAQQQGLLTAEEATEKERRLAVIRDSAIEKATILAGRMREQFTAAGIANQNMADSASSAYQQLLSSLDPVMAQQQRYQAELNSAVAIVDAANVSEQERARVLNLVAAAYDPVTIAANKRTAAAEAEMVALRRSIDLAQEEVRARATQDRYNAEYAPGLTGSSSARDSAGVFAEEFARQDQLQRELAETAAKEQELIATRERLRAQYDPIYAVQQRYERQLRDISTALEMQAIDERMAGRAKAAATADYQRQRQELSSFSAANDVARGSVGRFGVIAQQAGFQVQDFFVQVASGQSALVAFAQQAPQLLGAFGTIGSLAGAALAIGAVGLQLAGVAGSANAASVETSAFDKVMGPLTRTIDDQSNSLKNLIEKYNEASESQKILTRLKLSASIVETTEKLEKQKTAFDDLIQSALAAQEFQTTAGNVPISAANIVKFGRPDFDIQQTPNLATDPVVQLGLQVRELRKNGDFVGVTDLISKFGKAGEEAGRQLLDTATAVSDLTDQNTRAASFLELVKQGLVKNYSATTDAGRAADDYTETLAGLAGERAWIEAARQGEGALRDLARQQAINTAETKVYQAAHKQAMADGVVSAQELAEITRVTAEAGDLAAQRFDLEATRKGAFGMKEIAAATRAYKDELEDVNRFLAEQAGGVTEAEKAYRPFAAQIEKMNDLLGRKGLSDPQKEEIFGRIAQLETAGAIAMDQAASDAERAHQQRMAGLEAETSAMEDRNRIAILERDGTYEARRAINDLNTTRALASNEVERQGAVAAAIRRGEIEDLTRINELYGRRAGAIKSAGDTANDNIYAGEAQQFSQFVQQALVDGSVDASSIIRSGIASALDQPLKDFYKDFRQTLEDAAPGIGKIIGDSLVGSALGDLVGNLLGRDGAQNTNAKIGGAIGGAVGNFLPGGSKVWSFIGNVVGGLFGPGKSDATAGAQIYTRDDRVQNFDTSASKQDAGNMSARDALAGSVMQYTNLLESIGGKLSSIVAIEVGSRDGNRWRVTDPNGQIVRSGVTAVGDVEGTLSQVLSAITDTLTGIPDTLKARLQSVDFSELSLAESDVNFILSYDLAIRKMSGTLEGGADAVEAARQQVKDLRGEVEDFSATATRLGFDTATTADALRAQVERFAGIGQTVPQMTEVEVQVAALRAAFAELGPVLELVGYSATEAAAAVTQAEETRMAGLRADVSGQQDRAYDSLIGNGYLNDIRDLISQRDKDIRDALAVGLTDAGAQRNFGAGLSGVLTSDLRADQLQEAIRLFGDIPAVAAAANVALANLSSGIEETASAARSAADIASERAGLEVRLMELQGDSAALLTRQRDALDINNRALFDQVQAAQIAADTTRERQGLEEQLLRAQGDVVALRDRERSALAENNRAIYDQIKALEDQASALEATTRAASVTAGLQERLLTVQQRNDPDAAIQALYRRQQAEFAAGQAAGYSAEQLGLLTRALAGEMVDAVEDLNAQTQATADQLQIRLLRARAADPLLSEVARTALESQATQIERARELASAGNDNVAAMLRAIHAADDLASANRAQADAAAEAARQAEEAAAALDRIRGIGGNIRGWVDQARAGGIENYLSPAEQLTNARNQYNAQLNLASANDNTALGAITGYAQRYVDALLANGASGTDTDTAIKKVLAQLDALPAVRSFDQQQIDLLGQIRDATIKSGADMAVAVSRLPAGASAAQIADALSPYFGTLDNNLDGMISLSEFKAAIAPLATDAVAAAWFKELDANGDGMLSRQEIANKNIASLAEAVSRLPAGASAAQIASALAPYFSTLDNNLDGIISLSEFKAAIAPLATDAVAAAWFKELDANGDGMLSRQEATTRATSGLSGGNGGTLQAISDLAYGGNRDRITIGDAIVRQLGTVGILISDGSQRLSNLHRWLSDVWVVMSGLLDKTKYNTAETAKKLGGGYAYAGGTDYHPGGWAMVGEQGPELAFLPQGAAVATAAESRAALNRPRSVMMPAPMPAANHNAAADPRIADEIKRQNALMAEQNKLLAEQNRLLRGQGETLDDIADSNARMVDNRLRPIVGRRAAAMGG
ncbi:hypothetical protein [Niveispirillum sp.]|uniref:hypothetical protein n=1 Tax=Niveispirillum sp. TaxID=1917217 RepID=UPI001B479515|nr:hypothetical protein [Niveispirillum sp.]MBP7339084.1 hypothetical protein [Niveispirillum sp.]